MSIFDQDPQKNFNKLLIFMNLYQHAKNQTISSICSGEMAEIKITQSDWLRAIWPLSHEPIFSQI